MVHEVKSVQNHMGDDMLLRNNHVFSGYAGSGEGSPIEFGGGWASRGTTNFYHSNIDQFQILPKAGVFGEDAGGGSSMQGPQPSTIGKRKAVTSISNTTEGGGPFIPEGVKKQNITGSVIHGCGERADGLPKEFDAGQGQTIAQYYAPAVESDQNRTGNGILLQNNQHVLIAGSEGSPIDFGGYRAYHPLTDRGKNHVPEIYDEDEGARSSMQGSQSSMIGKGKAGSSTSNTNGVVRQMQNEGSEIVDGEAKSKQWNKLQPPWNIFGSIIRGHEEQDNDDQSVDLEMQIMGSYPIVIVNREVKPMSEIQEITKMILPSTLSGGIALASMAKTGSVSKPFYYFASVATAIGFLSSLAAILMKGKHPKLAAYAGYVAILGTSIGFFVAFMV